MPQASTGAGLAPHFGARGVGLFLNVSLNSVTRPRAPERGAPRAKWDATGVAMQHQLSNSNASTTIGRVLARFAETEATRGVQFISNVKPEVRERIRLVERALRAAAQGCAPRASSGSRHGDRQLS